MHYQKNKDFPSIERQLYNDQRVALWNKYKTMLYISYRGTFDGQNFENANTPNQIGKAFNAGFSCMVDIWLVDNKFYLGNDQPLVEVMPTYFKGNKFWLNARNIAMQNWLQTQPNNLYPNYFWFASLESNTPAIASNGKIITPSVVPINNNSVIFLPELYDKAMFSTVKLQCFGICSSYLTFAKRMRNEGVWY